MRVCLAVVLAVAAGACSDGPSAPAGTASLTLKLTDSPYSDARAVLVTFSSVSVHRTGGAFTTLPFSDGAMTRTCDLKKLQGAQDILGTGGVPAGDYTQIRLVVSGAALYFENASNGPACATSIQEPAGNHATLTIPSGEVRLNRPFSLSTDSTTGIVLDFRGDESIHQSGDTYTMTPVISVVSVQ
jgi:hypothetical protein